MWTIAGGILLAALVLYFLPNIIGFITWLIMAVLVCGFIIGFFALVGFVCIEILVAFEVEKPADKDFLEYLEFGFFTTVLISLFAIFIYFVQAIYKNALGLIKFVKDKVKLNKKLKNSNEVVNLEPKNNLKVINQEPKINLKEEVVTSTKKEKKLIAPVKPEESLDNLIAKKNEAIEILNKNEGIENLNQILQSHKNIVLQIHNSSFKKRQSTVVESIFFGIEGIEPVIINERYDYIMLNEGFKVNEHIIKIFHPFLLPKNFLNDSYKNFDRKTADALARIDSVLNRDNTFIVKLDEEIVLNLDLEDEKTFLLKKLDDPLVQMRRVKTIKVSKFLLSALATLACGFKLAEKNLNQRLKKLEKDKKIKEREVKRIRLKKNVDLGDFSD